MTNYAFKQREIAQELIFMARESMLGQRDAFHAGDQESWSVSFVKMTEEIAPLDTSTEPDPTISFGVGHLCGINTPESMGINPTVTEDEETDIEVFNIGSKAIAEDAYVLAVRVGMLWYTDGKGGNEVTVQFQLKTNLNLDQYDMVVSGASTGHGKAIILSSTDPDYAVVGSEVHVYDTKNMFPWAVGSDNVPGNAGSIGWAHAVPYNTCRDGTCQVSEILSINQCSQSVDKWHCFHEENIPGAQVGESVTVQAVSPASVWPYNDFSEDVSLTATTEALNVHPFTAAAPEDEFGDRKGTCTIQRMMSQSPLGNSDQYQVPFNVEKSPHSTWHITAVSNPVARWIGCTYLGANDWDEKSEQFWEGTAPNEYAAGADITTPTDLNTLGMAEGADCLPAGSDGIAFLDSNQCTKGQLFYIPIMTSSALNGDVTGAAVAGTLNPVQGSESSPAEQDIVIVNGCAVDTKTIAKTWLFGDTAVSESTGCKMAESTEQNEFENWHDTEVVTGLSVDSSSGETVITAARSTVKSCDYGGYASEIYITLPPVDYYDIMWPDGCSPCPPGCCTVTYYDDTTGTFELTEGDCNALEGTGEPGEEVISVEWSSEPCPTGCCTINYLDESTGEVVNTSTECDDLVGTGTPGEDDEVISTEWVAGDCVSTPTGCCITTAEPYGTGGWTEVDCMAEPDYISWASGDCADPPDPVEGCVGCVTCADLLELTAFNVSWTNVDDGVNGGFGGGIDQASLVISANSDCDWTVTGFLTSDDPDTDPVLFSVSVNVNSSPQVDCVWSPLQYAGVTLPTRMFQDFYECAGTYGLGFGGGVVPFTPVPSQTSNGSWNEANAEIVECTLP